MKYRNFGRLDWEVSALGFGGMRFPLKDGGIDEAKTIEMLRHAIDRGINYIDSGYGYHGGRSEAVIGLALRDGYRDRVRIATKLLLFGLKDTGDCDRRLDEQEGGYPTP